MTSVTVLRRCGRILLDITTLTQVITHKGESSLVVARNNVKR